MAVAAVITTVAVIAGAVYLLQTGPGADDAAAPTAATAPAEAPSRLTVTVAASAHSSVSA